MKSVIVSLILKHLKLVLFSVTDITDEDMTDLSAMLSSNTTLKEEGLYKFI